jgi:hypothetical protein
MSDEKQSPDTGAGADSTVQLIRPENFRHVFSNYSRVRVGTGEIGLTFSYVEEISGAGQQMTDLISITMTPVHAKRMVVMLGEILKQYEADIGSIDMRPPSKIDMEAVRRHVNAILGEGTAETGAQ